MNSQLFSLLTDDYKTLFGDSFSKSSNYSIHNTDTGYKLTFAVPGFEKDEITVKAEKEDLIIEAKTEREDFPHYLRNKIKKTFYVQDLDAENISAKLNAGILTVEFTTDKKMTAKTIAIN